MTMPALNDHGPDGAPHSGRTTHVPAMMVMEYMHRYPWEIIGVFETEVPDPSCFVYSLRATPQIGTELFLSGRSIEGIGIGPDFAGGLTALTASLMLDKVVAFGDTIAVPAATPDKPDDLMDLILWVGHPVGNLRRYQAFMAEQYGATLITPILWSSPLGADRGFNRNVQEDTPS